MATQVQFRRGSTPENNAFKGAQGEITVDTSERTLRVHDGSLTGGYPLLKRDGTNSELAAGNLSSCALKFANDSNTGINRPGADQLAFVTGGVARLTIDSSGAATFSGNVSVNGNLTATTTSFSDQIALILALG
tara:strand:+ start:12252 stop:12653 length:402 start_codon:yes stop_codon:yes gene_type:complete